MKALRAVVGYLPAPVPDPVAATAAATVPASLRPTGDARTARQESLF